MLCTARMRGALSVKSAVFPTFFTIEIPEMVAAVAGDGDPARTPKSNPRRIRFSVRMRACCSCRYESDLLIGRSGSEQKG